MLDKIMEMVGGDALSAITSKAGISMDQAKQMLPLAKDSLEEGVMSEVKSGNTEGLVGLFNSVAGGGLMKNGIFSMIKGLFMKKIMSNMGLPESVAGLAAGSGLGSIIGSLAGKMQADGDNDGIDASNLMSVLGSGGAGGLLSGLMGGKGGGLMDNVSDIAGNILGGKKDDDKKGGRLLGGLKDAAGGLFGK